MGANTIITICRGIILDRQVRRQVMTASVVAAAGLLFVLTVVGRSFWTEHPWFFIFLLLSCGWMTILSALLAIYDMLMVRANSRREKKRLKSEILGDHKDEP